MTLDQQIDRLRAEVKRLRSEWMKPQEQRTRLWIASDIDMLVRRINRLELRRLGVEAA